MQNFVAQVSVGQFDTSLGVGFPYDDPHALQVQHMEVGAGLALVAQAVGDVSDTLEY